MRAASNPDRIGTRRAALRVATALTVLSLAAACSSPAVDRSSAARKGSSTAVHRVRHPSTSTTVTTPPPTSTTTTIDPGLLPQTPTEPSTGSSLTTEMQFLWSALVNGSEQQALAVFFPEGAYITTKTGQIPNPSADYTDRLIAFYQLDTAAYHQLLASGTGTPILTGVESAATDAAWIGPGQCENDVGYWHLPGVRLVYQQDGTVHSFAVASLISWRGMWYVVHLGPNPRPANVGTVDQPAAGPGLPGPPGGC
jgi:hypothetical protein